jgi:y4mF family transcriptional regulator
MWAQSSIEVGRVVAAARRHRGLTQEELARQTGVTQAWISQVEKGKDNAQIGKVLRLLSYLGVRLRVGEAPWIEAEVPAGPAGPVSLSQVLDRLSGKSSAPVPRKRLRK